MKQTDKTTVQEQLLNWYDWRIEAMNLLLTQDRFQFLGPFNDSVIVLLWATIESLIWIGSSSKSGFDEMKSDEFIKWVDKYLVPNSSKFAGRQISGIDCWAARCAMLHTGQFESRKSYEGKATRLSYCWGKKDPGEFQQDLDEISKRKPSIRPVIVVHIESLLKEVTKQAYGPYSDYLIADKNRLALAIKRVETMSNLVVEYDSTNSTE